MRDFLRLNMDAVVDDWGDFEPTTDEIEAMLEVAFLAIASDGVVTRSEIEAFAVVMERLFGPNITSDRIEEVLDQYEDSLDRGGFRRRLTSVASELRRPEARDHAYQLAYAMAMCDLDTNIHEFEFDQVLREQFGLDDEQAERLVDGVVDLVIKEQAPSQRQ